MTLIHRLCHRCMTDLEQYYHLVAKRRRRHRPARHCTRCGRQRINLSWVLYSDVQPDEHDRRHADQVLLDRLTRSTTLQEANR